MYNYEPLVRNKIARSSDDLTCNTTYIAEKICKRIKGHTHTSKYTQTAGVCVQQVYTYIIILN